MGSVALHVSTDTPALHPSANGQGMRPASRRTYIRKLLRMAEEMRPYLRQYQGHMVAAAGLTREQAQVLQALSNALDDLHSHIGRPLFPEVYEVKPRRRLLLHPDQSPDHYRGTLHKQQGGLCHYCGARLYPRSTTKEEKRASKRGAEWQPAEVDHAVPRCRGGKDEPSNYRLACGHCNQEKGRLTEEEYLAVIAAGVRLVELTPGGRRYWLRPRSRVSIGSARRNGIVIDHPSVSSRHAELLQDEDGRWVVSDLGSATGTYVSYNGADAEHRVKVKNALKHGSTVRFGEVCLRLEPGAR
jgi:5-methylcytosine-specific restriction endonuclease McrA